MKKLTLVTLALFALSMAMPVSAQVQLGAMGGLNLANLTIDPDQGMDLKTLTAFGFGGVFNFDLGNNLVISAQPMYLQKGSTAEMQGNEMDIKLAYLEVPLMAKYAFGSEEFKPYLMAGPTIGFNLSAEVESEQGTEDIKDDLKGIDFGIGVGAGVCMPMGNNSVFVEARYGLGLSNINDKIEGVDDLKTNGIQIFAGFTFPLGN